METVEGVDNTKKERKGERGMKEGKGESEINIKMLSCLSV